MNDPKSGSTMKGMFKKLTQTDKSALKYDKKMTEFTVKDSLVLKKYGLEDFDEYIQRL